MANIILPPGMRSAPAWDDPRAVAEFALAKGVELKRIAHDECQGDPNVAAAALARALAMVAFEARLPIRAWMQQVEAFYIAEQSRT
jgi:hypothetical protein